MTISERALGDVTIIDLGGRITVQDGAGTFRDMMQTMIKEGRVRIVLNFNDVSYVDSTALGQVVRAYTGVTRKGGSLKLLNVPPKVHHLLVVTKLLSVFDLFDDEAEALKSFGAAHT